MSPPDQRGVSSPSARARVPSHPVAFDLRADDAHALHFSASATPEDGPPPISLHPSGDGAVDLQSHVPLPGDHVGSSNALGGR